MADITKFPVEKVHPRMVRGQELWDQEAPPDEMVWALCPYTRGGMPDRRCRHCPPGEEGDHGTERRGCYMYAQEACRVVFAMQKRGEGLNKPSAEVNVDQFKFTDRSQDG